MTEVPMSVTFRLSTMKEFVLRGILPFPERPTGDLDAIVGAL